MASDPSLGFVLTRQNAHVQVIRKDDGGVSLVDLRTLAAIDLCAAERDQLRELLDRAAMPGQVSARVFPCCKCCERERGLTGAGPCVPPRHLTRCVNGCDDAAQAVSG